MRPTGFTESPNGFTGLVTVSFSAFDEYGPLLGAAGDFTVCYHYVVLLKNAAMPSRSSLVHDSPSPTTLPLVKARKEL